MFSYSQFDQDISKWNISNVTYMHSMFQSSQFNQDISKWDVSKVIKMNWMFQYSHFNQDISKWDISIVTDMVGMFEDTDNPTRFKLNIEKLLMNMKIEFESDYVNGNHSSQDPRMFREIIVGIYE